jgi:DNA invertase Pin-like site-specific DNA recombinase
MELETMATRKLRASPAPSQPAAYGYCRVSTDQQRDSGISIEEQRRKIEARAAEMGWNLAGVFVDAGVSGSIPLGQRPEGARLLEALRPGDIVVAARMDRCFRSAFDALETIKGFKSRKIALWLLDLGDVSGNGISELIVTVLAAVAQFERSLISERIVAAKQNQRRAGKHLGGSRPFGYRLKRRPAKKGERERAPELVEDPREQAAIGLMRAMRIKGETLAAISTFLRGRGYKISAETVRVVLQRPVGGLLWAETAAGEAA